MLFGHLIMSKKAARRPAKKQFQAVDVTTATSQGQTSDKGQVLQ